MYLKLLKEFEEFQSFIFVQKNIFSIISDEGNQNLLSNSCLIILAIFKEELETSGFGRC